MRGRDERHLGEQLANAGYDFDLPARVQVQIELVDEHQTPHLRKEVWADGLPIAPCQIDPASEKVEKPPGGGEIAVAEGVQGQASTACLQHLDLLVLDLDRLNVQ